MSLIRHIESPDATLYRIGRLPDPLAWPPRQFVGGGRFDDPRGGFRVLYATAQRRGAFMVTLARFRPSLEALARLRRIAGSDDTPSAVIPPDWYRKRAVAQIHLASDQRWLDLRAAETFEALRREMAEEMIALGLPDLDLSAVVGPQRAVTQAVARWTYEAGFAGLVYSSRFDALVTC